MTEDRFKNIGRILKSFDIDGLHEVGLPIDFYERTGIGSMEFEVWYQYKDTGLPKEEKPKVKPFEDPFEWDEPAPFVVNNDGQILHTGGGLIDQMRNIDRDRDYIAVNEEILRQLQERLRNFEPNGREQRTN